VTAEKPHPEMTDQELLEKLLPIALSLLEADRTRGEPLWGIYKYLEKRLGVEPEKKIQADKIEFHNANVTIYLRDT
jgi:hypothetical protein